MYGIECKNLHDAQCLPFPPVDGTWDTYLYPTTVQFIINTNGTMTHSGFGNNCIILRPEEVEQYYTFDPEIA
jgi:hypothetical protein